MTETWLQKHERIVIVFLVLLVGGFLGNKWLDRSAAEAQARATVAEQAAAQARQEASQAASQYQAALDLMSKQNAALAASQTARNANLAKAQTELKSLPPDEFVQTWQSLLPGRMPGQITPQAVTLPDGSHATNVVVETGPAIETVNALEEVPVLKANLADETTIAGNTQKELDTCGVLVTDLKKQVATDDAACKAETANLKAEARKSKRNWFVAGMSVAAAVIGIAAHVI